MGVGQTRSKGRQRPPRRLNGGVGRGRSRCCRAVLALAGFSGLFAHIVPTQPQVLIPLNPCKLLSLLEPASGLEPLTCGLRIAVGPNVFRGEYPAGGPNATTGQEFGVSVSEDDDVTNH